MQDFENILVAVDTRFDHQPALQWAAKVAEHQQARLKVVDVLPEYTWLQRQVIPDVDVVRQALHEDKQRKLEELAAPLRKQGLEVEVKVLTGKTSRALVEEATESAHDLVVRVTKGAHSQRTGLFGTTSMRLIRNCPCAVWLVQASGPPRFSRILLPVEPAPDDLAHHGLSQRVMEFGQAIAAEQNGELHVVHSWNLFMENSIKSRLKEGELDQFKAKAETEANAAMDKFLAPYSLSHESDNVHVIYDELGSAHAITELAKQESIDLIVIGTIARTGVAGGLVGNTAESVLDHATCPVLTVKPVN